MKSLKITLIFLSVFVFCVEQNNIIASPYGKLPEGEKREKTKKEKIQEWIHKNWGYLKWVLGGLAVGAGALAYKKGYFGGSASCNAGGVGGAFVPIKKKIYVVVEFLKKNVEKEYHAEMKTKTDENAKKDLTEKYEENKNKLDELEIINRNFLGSSSDSGILHQFLLYKLFNDDDFKTNNDIYLNYKANVKGSSNKFMYNLEINRKLAKIYFNIVLDIYNKKDLAEFADYKEPIKNDKSLQEFFGLFDKLNKQELETVFNEFFMNLDATVKLIIEKKENVIFEDGLKNALKIKLLEYKKQSVNKV